MITNRDTAHTHGASCTCPPCMERSDRAFTVWYDTDEADPAASLVAQAFAAQTSEPAWRPTTPPASMREEPPLWQHRPPTCGRCGAKMRYPRAAQGDGWTWGAFGWKHDCGWHR